MVYHPAVIYRRNAVLDLGGYRPECREAEDLDLFLRLAEVGQIAYLPEPLLKYREHRAKAGISRSKSQRSSVIVILEEGRKRHNLGPVSEHVSRQASLAVDPSQIYQTWAWWALMSAISPPRASTRLPAPAAHRCLSPPGVSSTARSAAFEVRQEEARELRKRSAEPSWAGVVAWPPDHI